MTETFLSWNIQVEICTLNESTMQFCEVLHWEIIFYLRHLTDFNMLTLSFLEIILLLLQYKNKTVFLFNLSFQTLPEFRVLLHLNLYEHHTCNREKKCICFRDKITNFFVKIVSCDSSAYSKYFRIGKCFWCILCYKTKTLLNTEYSYYIQYTLIQLEHF